MPPHPDEPAQDKPAVPEVRARLDADDPPRPGELSSGADLAAVARLARNGTEERLYGGQTSAVTLVTLPDGRRAVRKAPRSWTEPDDARFDADGEELAALLAAAIGAPVARVYRDGPATVWTEYIDGTRVEDGQLAQLAGSPEAIRIGLLDAMTGNGDRAGNLMIRDGRLVGYDHGGAWLYSELGYTQPVLREPSSPVRHFVAPGPDPDDTTGTWRDDPPLSPAELAGIRDRVQALRPAFERAGRGAWLDYSISVLDRISERAEHAAAVRQAHEVQSVPTVQWNYGTGPGAAGEAGSYGSWQRATTADAGLVDQLGLALELMLTDLTTVNAGRTQVRQVTDYADRVRAEADAIHRTIEAMDTRYQPVIAAVSTAGGPGEICDTAYYQEI